MKIEVLFEDDFFVAVNKPADLPVHATHDVLRPHLQGYVETQIGQSLVLFHRLDLDTTGVVLFGKDPEVNRAVTEMFKDREMDKTYWAVVDGRWLDTWTEVQTYIAKTTGGRWANRPKGKGGDLAITQFKVLKTNGDKSWLEVKPKTGRTHQIRLHCLEKTHSVLGDRQYGRANAQGIPMALHARQLQFVHPKTNEKITVEASAPSYWKDHWLKSLR